MMQTRRGILLAGLAASVTAFTANAPRAEAADGSVKVGVEVVFLSEAEGKVDTLNRATQSALSTAQFKAFKTRQLLSNTSRELAPGNSALLPALPNGHTVTLSVSPDRRMLKAILSTRTPTNVEAPLSGGALLVVDAKPYNGGIIVVAITSAP